MGPHFFTKAPSFQGSSKALKKNIVYKGCSPSIGCASGITPFFEGKERQQVKEQNKQKMKDTEHKGKGQEGKKNQKENIIKQNNKQQNKKNKTNDKQKSKSKSKQDKQQRTLKKHTERNRKNKNEHRKK